MNDYPKVKVTQRLHFKIALFVIITIIIIFGLFSIYQIYSYRQKLTAMEIQSSEELGRTLAEFHLDHDQPLPLRVSWT